MKTGPIVNSSLQTELRNYLNQSDLARFERSELDLDTWLQNEFKQCNAKTRDGKQCQGRAINGTNKCKNHGGKSTGPKTKEGKAKALANLKQYRNKKSTD